MVKDVFILKEVSDDLNEGKNSSGNEDGQQETGKAIYSFMDVVAGKAEEYAAGHTTPMSPVLEEIERYTLEESGYPSMLTGRVQGRFLQLIVSLSGFRDVVDIGTFTGYSALAVAESVPPEGRVLTIEHNPANADIVQGFFDKSPHGGKIDLQRGETVDVLKSLLSAHSGDTILNSNNNILRTSRRCSR